MKVGRALDQLAILLRFRIENAQRVALEAAHGIGAQGRDVRAKVRQQRLAVGRTAVCIADAVDVQRGVIDPVAREQVRRNLNDLDVGFRARHAEALDAELIGLPVAPGLRPLVAKERADVGEPLRALPQQVVLEDRAPRRRPSIPGAASCCGRPCR